MEVSKIELEPHILWGSGKLVTIKISHCYNVLRRGCNSYKQYVVSILLQHVFIVTILLQHISLVTMQIGCNNVKIKHLLLQRLLRAYLEQFPEKNSCLP